MEPLPVSQTQWNNFSLSQINFSELYICLLPLNVYSLYVSIDVIKIIPKNEYFFTGRSNGFHELILMSYILHCTVVYPNRNVVSPYTVLLL